MELKQIKELMAAMGRTGTVRLALKKEGFELQLEREENGIYRVSDQMDLDEPIQETAKYTPASLRNSGSLPTRSVEEKEDTTSVFITSPMVGTFYGSPSPEDPSFVKVGERVEKNSVVCIVEAMKVMNEIKAGVSGTILEVLVESGHPVEFGTKLFRLSSETKT